MSNRNRVTINVTWITVIMSGNPNMKRHQFWVIVLLANVYHSLLLDPSQLISEGACGIARPKIKLIMIPRQTIVYVIVPIGPFNSRGAVSLTILDKVDYHKFENW